MKKENQRVLLTKQLLRNALLRLLESRHIDKVSVKELCGAADINRSTFYRYYTMPKDILLEIETEIFQKLRITKPLQGPGDVRAYLEQGFQYLYDHAGLMRLLIRNTAPDDYTGLMNDFARGILEANGTGDISPKKLRLLLAYVSAGSFYTIRQWLDENEPLHPAELIDFTMDLANQCLRAIG